MGHLLIPFSGAAAVLVTMQATLAGAQCTVPDELPPADLENFSIQVRNESYPEVHNHYLWVGLAGAGDQHLYIDWPDTLPTNLSLEDGVLYYPGPPHRVHACINREYHPPDGSTKLFMTERDEPEAIWSTFYQCNPDTDELEIHMKIEERRSDPPEIGGQMNVRWVGRGGGLASYDFRWTPEGNTAIPDEPRDIPVAVDMVIIPSGVPLGTSAPPPTTTTTITATTTATTTATETNSPTSTGLPFTDLTHLGWAFEGCAPDSVVDRTLPDVVLADDGMTNLMCLEWCDQQGYVFGGTEYARECWCGREIREDRVPGDTVESLAGCDWEGCAGDREGDYCGGPDWLSLYRRCMADAACLNAEFA